MAKGTLRALSAVVAAFLTASCVHREPAEPDFDPKYPTRLEATQLLQLKAFGDTARIVVQLLNARGQPVVGLPVTFTSDVLGSVATVSRDGIVTAVGNGGFFVFVRHRDLIATTSVNVNQEAATIVSSADSLRFDSLGDTARIRVTGRDARGNPMAGFYVLWISSNPTVVDVVDGVFIARGNGATAVRGLAYSTQVQVHAVVGQVPRTLRILRSRDTLTAIGDTLSFSAQPVDGRGNVMSARPISWSVTPSGIATVDSLGRVVALAPGLATVTAALSSTPTVTAQAQLVVRPKVARISWMALPNDLLEGLGLRGVAARLEDARGNLVASPADSVTLTLLGGPAGSALGGPRSVAAVAGIAEFATTTISTPGVAYRLVATAGAVSATSLPFDVHHRFRWLAMGVGLSCGRDYRDLTWCWGTGDVYTDGTTKNLLPRRAPVFDPFQSLAIGTVAYCGLELSGVKCWGAITDPESTVPVAIGQTAGTSALDVGADLCVLKADNLWCMPEFTPLAAAVVSLIPGGQPTLGHVRVGGNTYCGLIPRGGAWCGGKNDLGQLGDGTTVDRGALGPVGNGQQMFVDIDVSTGHACAIDLTGAAYCWGSNHNGRLGNLVGPDQVLPGAIALQSKALRSVRLGEDHGCGLADDQRVYCWGWNGVGQRGVGEAVSDATFAPVPLSIPAGDVKVGGETTCALSVNGQAWCWGRSRFGSVGNGTTANVVWTPVAVGVSP